MLLEACIVTQSYVERAITKELIFEQLVSSAAEGREVSIVDIKAAYNALLQADLYVKYVHWMLDEYIALPSRPERLWTFAKTIFPPTALGQFFASAGKNIEDLRNLNTTFAESDNHVTTEVSASVDAKFSETEKSKIISDLASADFFDRQPPVVEVWIGEKWIVLGGDPELVDMTNKFSDPNGDRLTFALKDGNELKNEVIKVNVAKVKRTSFTVYGEQTARSVLEIIPMGLGEMWVTVVATDSTRLSEKQSFKVVVTEANSPPQIIKPLPAQTLTRGSSSPQLDLGTYFMDLDSAGITYESVSNDTDIATVRPNRSSSVITIFANASGVTTVTVTATDTDRASTSQTIEVTVPPPEVEQPNLPDLVVESISASKTALAPGESFTLTATVTNKGRARSRSLTMLRYYGPDHSEVGTSRVERLEPNQTSKEKRITLKALDEPGTYYYDVCVSRASGEVNIDNNCSTRVAITVGAPANQPPIASGTIPARTLAAGSSSVVVDVFGNFRDPDNDALTYTVRSDSIDVATVSVSDSQVTLTPQDAGIATITVTANDGELTAVQRFSVSVTAAPVANRPPVNVSRILDQTLAANGAVVRLDLSTHFSDADGDLLTYTITSDNPNVAFLQVVGASVSIFPLSTVGRANVRVTASDGDLTAIQDFIVIVQRTQPVNQAPVAIGTIASQTLTVDGAARQGNISNYFRDPDGNNLTYTARSDDTDVVRTSMSRADLTLTPVRAGSATVTVTASDGSLTATQRFTVQVQSKQSRCCPAGKYLKLFPGSRR